MAHSRSKGSRERMFRGRVPFVAVVLRWLLGTMSFVAVASGNVSGATTAPASEDRFPTRAVFHLGHDVRWSDPAWDDRDWAAARLDRSWHRQGLVPDWRVGHEGWYRMEFVLEPEALGRSWIASAGHVGTISRLWINGHELGGVGSFERAEVTAQRVLHAGVVPSAWLRAGTNSFAVRVRNVAAEGGILGGPVGLFPTETFLRTWKHRELQREVPRAMLSALCFGWALVPWLLRFAGNDRREFAGASVPAFLLGLQMLLFTQWLNSHEEPRFGALLALMVWLVSAAMPASVYGLMHNLTGVNRFWDRWIIAGTVLYLPLSIGAATELPRLMTVYIGYMAWVMIAVVARARQAPAERRWLVRALMMGSAVLFVCGVTDASLAFFPLFPQAAAWWDPMDIGVLAFLGTLGAALSRRHVVARRRERELGGRLVHAHIEERRQLGRLLHDGVVQDLLFWRQRTEATAMPPEPAAAAEAWRQLHEGLGSAARDLRRVAEDLQPIVSRDLPLSVALARLGERLGLRHGIPIRVEVTGLDGLSERVTDTLFRIAQEAVNNACRHSAATEVVVSAGQSERETWLQVRDQGRGFDPAAVGRPSGHLGLRFLHDHAEWAGGALTVDSAPGRGTTIRVVFRGEAAFAPAEGSPS